MDRTATTTDVQLFDAAEVRRALELLLPAGQVTELRILDAVTIAERWPHTASGYFDDPEKLIAALDSVRTAKGIYVIPNPVKTELLARAANRIKKAGKGEASNDNDVTARHWLLIDCDPQRPEGISSTNKEHKAALKRCRSIHIALRHNYGFCDPILCDSGNGAHLIYRVDLPVNDGGLVQRCLTALAAQFDDEAVKVDTGVFNPARIWKLYGTLACKGDSIPDRPHRLSRIVQAPDRAEVVNTALLESLAGDARIETPQSQQQPAVNGQFDIDSFLQRHGFDVAGPDPYLGGRKWTFHKSPMCDHDDDGPFLIQFPSGALSAGCHHNSCTWGWDALRAKYDPKPDASLYDRLIANAKANTADNSNVVTPPPVESGGEFLLSDLMPVSEFLRRSDDIRYLIPYVIVAKQGGIISGKMKNLKTTVAIDLNISMATATPFLNFFDVPTVTRCAFLCGESGEATIKADIRRIAKAKGIDAPGGEVDNLFVSTRCPRLQSLPWLDEIRRVIDKHDLGVVSIDPTYLAAAGVKQNDLSAVAALLEPLNRIIGDTSCTILLVHHNRKISELRYGCPTLEEITGSGYGEWARFWLLLNKRREWDDLAGQHWLWLVTGGSAGFGSRKWLDVIEGKPTDQGGRVWDVEVVAAGEGESREKAERERQREEQHEANSVNDQKAIVDVLRKRGATTKTELKTRAPMTTDRQNAALMALLDRGDIEIITVTKGNNRKYESYKIAK